MKINVVDLRDIMPYYNNPRDNANAVPPVIESIKRYGFIKPIICDKDGVIIAGHTRYIAAYQMGLTKVPVVYSEMDDEKAKLFRIADNKLAEKSEFDEDKLIEELKALEVPENMQAFFFEDVNELINFSYNDFVPTQNADYTDDSESEYDFDSGRDIDEPNAVSGSENSEDEYDGDDGYGKSNPDSEYDDLYKVRIVDGKKLMKVVCPYCGNIETIEVE